MGTQLKYQNYRICYENGNSKTGRKTYELYKYCKCEECQYNLKHKRLPPKRATAYTADSLKIDEVADFLNNWNCKQENTEVLSTQKLDITYFYFGKEMNPYD
jgi:hypothetical protein